MAIVFILHFPHLPYSLPHSEFETKTNYKKELTKFINEKQIFVANFPNNCFAKNLSV